MKSTTLKHCLVCKKQISNRSKFCSMNCNLLFRKSESNKIVESGKGSFRQAKSYLINKHGNICLSPSCAWDFNKSQINVELEHIDGNSENNNLENLTLLCPNCHSLTPTYKSKNKGNGRFTRRIRYKNNKSF